MEASDFVRVGAAVPVVTPADCGANARSCAALMEEASRRGVRAVCFPALSLTGCTCGALFRNRLLLQSAENALARLLEQTKGLDVVAIVGLPVHCDRLAGKYSPGGYVIAASAVIQKGEIVALASQAVIAPDGSWQPMPGTARTAVTLMLCGRKIKMVRYPVFDDGTLRLGVMTDDRSPVNSPLMFRPTVDAETAGSRRQTAEQVTLHSWLWATGLIHVSPGFGESSTDRCYTGNAFIAADGDLLAETERFSLDDQLIVSDVNVKHIVKGKACPLKPGFDAWRPQPSSQHPFYPDLPAAAEAFFDDIFNLQAVSLAVRLKSIRCERLVIGVSGGLDSTLALLVAAKTFDRLKLPRRQILGVTMPGYGTTGRTYDNALALMNALGVEIREIPIAPACDLHFRDIGHDPAVRNVVYENAQARERTQILFDLSNELNAIVLGTGDLSELALGWCTYGGDHLSSYGVNAGLPKTLVQQVVRYAADRAFPPEVKPFLADILDTPISPELLPADASGAIAQKTEDLVGPYELHDFFLYHMMCRAAAPSDIRSLALKVFEGKFDEPTVTKWLGIFTRRFFTQQFKRSCMPDGPQLVAASLSPREGWKMPSDLSCREWLDDCNR